MKKIYIIPILFVFINIYSQNNNIQIEKLTDDYARKISRGQIGLEGDWYDTLLFGFPSLNPLEDDDGDGIRNDQEIYIYTKNGKKYIGYNSHPRLEDTDGDGYNDGIEQFYNTDPLLWDITSRDMAMFMELAYREDDYINQVLDHNNKNLTLHKDRKEYKMMNRELATYWNARTFYHRSNGFDAVLLEFDSPFPFLKNKEIQVLAVRGTAGGNDLDDDVSIAVARHPAQLNDALDILKGFSGDNTIKKLYSTGHSLGGYLAQGIAAQARLSNYSWFKKAYTFNAPNIRANLLQPRWFKNIRDKSYEISNNGDSRHYAVANDGVTNGTGRFPNAINVGNTAEGHSSRSYFEKMIGDRSDFQVGKRNTMDGEGYVDSNLEKLRIIKLEKDNYDVNTLPVNKYVGEEVTTDEISRVIKVVSKDTRVAFEGKIILGIGDKPIVSIDEIPRDVTIQVEVIFPDGGAIDTEVLVHYDLNTTTIPPLNALISDELEKASDLLAKAKIPEIALRDLNAARSILESYKSLLQSLVDRVPGVYNTYTQRKVNDLITESQRKLVELKTIRRKIELIPQVDSITEESTHLIGKGIPASTIIAEVNQQEIGRGEVGSNQMINILLTRVQEGERIRVKAETIDTELGRIESYPIELIVLKLSYVNKVGINTSKPRATLDIREVDINALPGKAQGVIFPSFTTEQRREFKGTKEGIMIYNTTLKCIEIFIQGVWKCLGQ